MIYGPANAVFTTMMYSSVVPLKPGERHCPHCSGHGIKPILRERGEKAASQRHEKCGCGTGKVKA